MRQSLFERYIDAAVKVFSKLFEVKVTWNFAIIESKLDLKYAETILMAYSPNDEAIIINPLILEVLQKQFDNDDTQIIVSLFSKIGHECRHAWQYLNFGHGIFEKDKTYGKIGDKYVMCKAEIDAYAMEQAILWILTEDKESKLQIPYVQDEVQALANHHCIVYDEALKVLLTNFVDIV